ncbi:MAG: type II secretion system protein [Candidatus Wallbacteria bacterium]
MTDNSSSRSPIIKKYLSHDLYKGFTIIEIFFSVIAIVLIMGIMMQLFGNYSGKGRVIEEKVELQKDARVALQRITKDIRRAHSIEYKSSKLSLQCFRGKPTIGAASGANTEKVEYYLDGGKLIYESVTANKKEQIADNVKDFKIFEKKDYIGVKIEAEVEIYVEKQKYDKASTFLLSKVYPYYRMQSQRYKGYFSAVDEDKEY